MADKSTIEWCDATWNPVRGCSRVSPGCGGANHEGGCYAERLAARFSDPGQPFHGFARRTPHGGQWTGKLALIDSQFFLPLHWKKPRRIFVNSMSDLFHEDLPDTAIDQVLDRMIMAPQHTYQVLTKRARRMRDYFAALPGRWDRAETDFLSADLLKRLPLPNLWLGVSVEDQPRADERVPDLLETPAAVRFLSCEPLLGPIDLSRWMHIRPAGAPRCIDDVNWVICGGESGPNARVFDLRWARSIRDQCKSAGVAFFMKQLGSGTGFNLHDRKGGDWNEWPSDLRIREFPKVADA